MKTKVFVTFLFSLLIAAASFAQENEKRFGLELNGGLSVATSKPGDVELTPGFGFEGLLHYRFMPHTGVYAGWGWNRFGADNSFAGADVCFEETGYVFGLQFKHPLETMPISYYLRAGGLYNHIEIENEQGDIIGDTEHGLGFQLAAGFDYSLGKNWSITPGLKFNYLSKDVEMEEVTKKLNHNYISLRVGFLKRF
jgi:opacity protein-like surface antigen